MSTETLAKAAFTDEYWPPEWEVPEGWELGFKEEPASLSRCKPLLCADLLYGKDLRVHLYYDRGWWFSSLWIGGADTEHIDNPGFLEAIVLILAKLQTWEIHGRDGATWSAVRQQPAAQDAGVDASDPTENASGEQEPGTHTAPKRGEEEPCN